MPIFKLSGNTSMLNIHLEHPIHLDEGVQYKVALVGFYSENNIYNLSRDSEILFENAEPLPVARGYWTLDTLQKHISKVTSKFEIKKENNRVVIRSSVKFHMDNTIRALLGFDPVTGVTFHDNYKADNAPNLRSVDVIEIHCDIVNTSFTNHATHYHKHDETSLLYQFYPTVQHGYKISEVPRCLHYVPLKAGLGKIQYINIGLLDQSGMLLQNPDSNNIVYIDIVRG